MNDTLYNIFLSWTPMFVLIAVWVFFMIRLKKNNPQEMLIEHVQVQNKLVERIAISLEEISVHLKKNSTEK